MAVNICGQLSIFDLLKDEKPAAEFNPLYEYAKRNPPLANGKHRILDYFTDELDRKKRAAFLKKEYGIGGFSGPRRSREEAQLHGAAMGYGDANGGILLSWWDANSDEEHEKRFSFEELHDAIIECIHNGDY